MNKLVWFREDLRLDDQRALLAAVEAARGAGSLVHAAWCHVPRQWDAHDMGANRRWFVLGAVAALARALAGQGIGLHVLDAGDFAGSTGAVMALARTLGCDALYFNDEYPLNEQRRDAQAESAARAAGIAVHRYHDGVLAPPSTVRKKDGTPYTVFTPYRQAWYRQLLADATLAPRNFRRPAQALDPAPLAAQLAATEAFVAHAQAALAVPAGVRSGWVPGEQEAKRRLRAFTDGAINAYRDRRDLPAVDGTSTLSPYLAAGCLSPRRALALARAANNGELADGSGGVVTWISELAWRDFYRQVVAHFPHVSMGHAFRRDTDAVRWRHDADDFAAWCEGRTGVPLVDAAMRQLRETGWMHNRLRMVTAMFLTKDLLIDWRWGERHFAQQLVDWDFAANNGGWQWSASTGTDAAPYFRLFNPVRQGERFDADGSFVRAWLPALAGLPAKQVHAPWLANDLLQAAAFAPPLIDHERAKARVLAAFRAARANDHADS